MASGASSSSSPSSSSSFVGPLTRGRYDVFISFRGKDTRTTFTCHLYDALARKQINPFIDYELHIGDEISPSLLRAIEESYVSVVVLSKNYATSKWCLDELVKIMECRRDHGQVVMPVFYDIDPSHVRHQLGSYKEAFEKHEKNSRVEKNKIQEWKGVLTEAANLSGCDSDSRSYRDDSELIEEIVKNVLDKLDCHYPPTDFKGLVGISRNFTHLESILTEVQSVGIWGMGGIGKTTFARHIFDKYSHQYEGSCFLENVREKSGECGRVLENLRNQLYSNLLKEEFCTTRSAFIEHRLRRQRSFIVLDDVSSSEQIKYLIGNLQAFGPGSRVIITTRDKSVLESTKVEHIHTMNELDDGESCKLFNLNAFNEEYPKIGYEELSRRAVNYCKGIPLAIKVLGSFLHSKSEIQWDSALKQLEKIPNEEIQNVLRLSYDGLTYEEKQIFLDIACFFKGEKTKHVIEVLDSCGLFPDIRMKTLHDKALIDIHDDDVWMHDLIQEMGREIVRQESVENPGSRSRLWDFSEICHVLENNEGTNAIKGIKLDMSQSQSRQNLCLSADTFSKMPNLRYLNMHGSLQLPNGMESVFNELRYLEWHGCPLPSLPNFRAEKLVTLNMPNGQFERLWDGEQPQNLVNLKKLELTRCKQLMELPNFSKAQNLKIVNLCGCRSLRSVHPSILSLGMLEELHLIDCEKLKTLESEIHLRSLNLLNVDGCLSLRKFSLSAEKMKVLFLSNTGIEVLDSSIGRFKKVEAIDLSGLRLEKLPKELSCLKSLETLRLSGCGQVVSKQNLHAIFDGLQSLRQLFLEHCRHLFELPDNIIRLSSLELLVLDESHVEKLPESIKDLPRLKILSLRGCRFLQSLPKIPSSIWQLKGLHLSGCEEVVSKQNLHAIFYGLQSLQVLLLESCQYLFELPDNIILLSSLVTLVLDISPVEKLPESIKDLSRLETLSLKGCGSLRSLPELPSSIRLLEAIDCELLQIVAPNVFDSGPQEEEYKRISFQNCKTLAVKEFVSSFRRYLSELVYGYQLRRRRVGGGAEERKAALLQLEIIYPDQRVPEWFKYQSKGASLTFDLPPPNSDHHFGLLLCVVLSPLAPSLFKPIDIKCECYLENDGKFTNSIQDFYVGRFKWPWKQDHVCLSYGYGCILEKINAARVNNQGASHSCNPKVTFKFFVLAFPSWNKEESGLIKDCGVHIVTASDYQTNETGAGNGTSRQRHEDTLVLEYPEDGAGVGSSSSQASPIPEDGAGVGSSSSQASPFSQGWETLLL